MSNMFKTLSSVAATTFIAVSSTTAMAGSTLPGGAVSIPAVIGAAYDEPNRADSAVEVRRQGGFATAGAVRWVLPSDVAARSVPTYGLPGVVGAMNESRALTRSAEEVRRAGGFATAGAVRWLTQAPASKVVAAY